MAQVKNLIMHLDDRGYLYEILRTDDAVFNGFAQYYVSAINPGAVKGFHKHSKQTDYVCCVSGQIKLVLVSQNEDHLHPVLGKYKIEEYHLSPLSPKLVVIAPEVYHGWMCIGSEPAIVINAASHLHDKNFPDEERIPPHGNPFGYVWEIVDK